MSMVRFFIRRSRYAARCAALLLLVGIGPLVLMEARPALAQPVSPDGAEKTAEAYAREGRDLASKNDLRGAHRALSEAWKRKKSDDIAGDLGEVEYRLGRAREAAEHLAFCHQNGGRTGDAAQRGEVCRLYAWARELVGTAYIQVTRDDDQSAKGAAVFVDGRRVAAIAEGGGVGQDLSRTSGVFVDPGPRTFSASAPGCEDVSATLTVLKGSAVSPRLALSCRKTVSISQAAPSSRGTRDFFSGPLLSTSAGGAFAGLDPGLTATFPLPAAIRLPMPPAATGSSGAPNPYVTIAGIALTGGGIIGGFAFMAGSESLDEVILSTWNKVTRNGRDRGACNVPANAGPCAALKLGTEHQTRFRNLSTGSFIAAGAFAVATAIYVIY
jgi:hypothetical protein